MLTSKIVGGKVFAKPILASVGHKDSTTTIDAGAIFREVLVE